ncbi:MAG: transcription antitermination factor NusB [Actinomycetota bacterium]
MPQNTRGIALDAVRRVVDEGGYSNLVIPGSLSRSSLDQRDRAFAADIAYGTIRHLRSIDWAIDQRASRPVSRMTANVRDVLRIGAFQLLFGGVAPHAAVMETVSLAAPRERGFANAVLRRLADDPPAWPDGRRDEDISIRSGMAPWAIRELRALLPEDAERAALAFAQRGSLCLRTNTCATTVGALTDALKAAGHDARRAPLDADCLLVDGGEPASFPGWEDGWFAVQDQASAVVVRLLDPQPGERILDACAGPGGKASMAACLVGSEGRVFAGDLHPRRAGLVQRSASRLRMHNVSSFAQDITACAVRGPFDRVLVDAPCSGLGSARRRPELLWRGKKEDPTKLAMQQVQIAAAASDLLKPGGRLVYAVCTFPRAETDAAADSLIRHRPDLVPEPTIGPSGEALRHRIWPHREGGDGMFIAVFRKRG